MEATTKDIPLNGKTYQIKRMDSDTGSWLLFKLLDSLRKVFEQPSDEEPEQQQPEQELTPEEKQKAAESGANAAIQHMLMTLDRPTFTAVKNEALRVCGQYTAVADKEIVLPVMMANGRLALPELATDIKTVVALTSNALYFNLAPFFLDGGLSSLALQQ